MIVHIVTAAARIKRVAAACLLVPNEISPRHSEGVLCGVNPDDLRHEGKSGWLRAGTYSRWLEGLLCERGQDLVEYAVVAALISLAAIASMESVAIAISAAYTHMGTVFSSYTS